jgi:hypothetical protein
MIMSEIKAYLDEYIYKGNTPFESVKDIEQRRLNENLRKVFLDWQKNVPAVSLLYHLINQANRSFHPSTALAIFESLNLNTYQEIYDWIHGLNIPDQSLTSLVWPELNLGELKKAGSQTIKKAVLNQAKVIPHLTDGVYQLVPEDQISYILDLCPSGDMQYIPDRRDCDDFARIMRGWLSEQGYGNLAIGHCEYKVFDSRNNIIIYHAVNMAVTESLDIFIIEPQSDSKFWQLSDTIKQYMGASRYEVVWVVL